MNRKLAFVVGFLAFLSPLWVGGQEELTLDSVQRISPDTNKVWAWIALSKQAMQKNLERARIYGDSALALSVELGFEKGKALSHKQIATATYYGGQNEDALQHYEQVLAYYEAQGDELNAAKILGNIGLVKRNQSQFGAALEYLFRALKIKEQYPDTNSLAFTYNTIGETHAILGDYEEAEGYFLKALQGFRAVGNRRMESGLLLNLGGYYQEQNDLDLALEFLKQAKEYFEVHGPQRELARSLYILANIYYDQNDLSKSQGAYLRSKVYFDSLGETMRSNGCLLKLAQIARDKMDFSQAKKLAKQTLSTSEVIGNNWQKANSLDLLAEINKIQGNYGAALEYREACEAIRDSILNEETNRTIAELKEKYQSEVRERELAELTSQKQQTELDLEHQKNQQRLLLIFTAFALIVAALLFVLYRSNKQLNSVLLDKNAIIQSSLDEKEVLLKEIHHRVKNNLQFISSLLNLQSRHISDPQTLQVLNEGKNRINSMALVHQKLYQEENLTGVDMESFIADLLDALQHSYQIDPHKVQIETKVEDLLLDVDTAIPIGLILNELITNAFKYAFEGQETGKLFVQLQETNGQLQLLVQDDGQGFPKGFDPKKAEQFGFELVRSLAAKLKANIIMTDEKGVSVTLHISKYQKK